ncbi:tRNA (adenosine(37)-N6)-threonylcarbamoyltransferase complex ATPase subunit type 1 TsaE [Dokdonella sp.]|uniref:tRNA (adenosine(37)-N6)-threonylcarbamoyltransferase complex ATPase subunit type 1 TsaE n=1 Tax=Dokdonella sp. TaxID=2291710 RepID=UPI0035299F28
MSASMRWNHLDEEQLVQLAHKLASAIGKGGVVFLDGDLGAGKTTFARALLSALGVGERIKSPTYSLLESYEAGDLRAHHLDLYRIADAEELEWLGLSDLLQGDMLMLVEWPQRALAGLPAPDLLLQLRHAGAVRDVEMKSCSGRGDSWLAALASNRSLAPADT